MLNLNLTIRKQLDKCKLGNLQSNWCKFFYKSHLLEKEDMGSVAQMVKHLSTMRETRVRSLGQEDPLKKEMAIHSRIRAWECPMDRETWWATVHLVTKGSDMT